MDAQSDLVKLGQCLVRGELGKGLLSMAGCIFSPESAEGFFPWPTTKAGGIS